MAGQFPIQVTVSQAWCYQCVVLAINAYCSVLPAKNAVPTLAQTIDNNFREWRTGDAVTLNQVNKEIDNAKLGTSKADAIVCLKVWVFQDVQDTSKLASYADVFDIKDQKAGITLANLKYFQTLLTGDPMGQNGAMVKKAKNLEAIYLGYMQQRQGVPLASSVDLIFGESRPTSDLANTIQQGILGDCSFVSALINYTRSVTLETLKVRIKPLPQEGERRAWNVEMYDAKGKPTWVKVLEPTPAQFILYTHATDGSAWVTLFSLASMEMRIRQNPKAIQEMSLVNGSYYEQAATGELLSQASIRLTGKGKMRWLKDFKPDNSNLIPILDKATSQVVTVSSIKNLPKEATDKHIFPTHAYAVLSYRDGIVTLRNPNNNNQVLGGRNVSVTLAELHDWFECICSQD